MSPTANGRTWRTAFQNASGVWPESVRPTTDAARPSMTKTTESPRANAAVAANNPLPREPSRSEVADAPASVAR